MMLRIDIHRWFAMVAILNLKWPPKYKNPPIWVKCGFQVDYDVAYWYPSLVCYGGHFESKMAAKIQKSSDLGERFPSRFWCWELISMVWEPCYDPLCRNIHRSMWQLLGGWKIQNGGHCHGNQGIKWPPNTNIFWFGLGEIWFPSRLWCCELIFIVGLLWCSELDETFQKCCLTCVHIILRLRNFRMAAFATKNVKNLKCSELDET